MDKEKKETQTTKEERKETKKSEKYFYAIGRRKTAISKARLYSVEKSDEEEWLVNKKKMKQYFPLVSWQNILAAPLKAVDLQNNFQVEISVKGGGKSAQAEAARLSIARALVISDKSLKKILKVQGFLTRDAREVERKKPGLKKARRAPQWAKR